METKETLLQKIQEDWGSQPQHDICVKILNYLLDNQKSGLILSHLTFATLRRVVGKNYTDENLLSAIQYLCGTRLSILEAKFELIINGEPFTISNEEVRTAKKTGEIPHPISGALLCDIDNLIFMYFSACSLSV
jgi:hypothetical protein